MAPLLFGLQQALAAPVAERALDAELHARLEALAEWQGAGAYDLAALASGRHGLDLGAAARRGRGAPRRAPAPPAAVVALLARSGHRGRARRAPARSISIPTRSPRRWRASPR